MGVGTPEDQEFSRRSSSFSRPTAFSSWSDRRELEHTSSPAGGSGGQGHLVRLHLPQRHGDPLVGQLPSGLAPGQPAPRIVTGSAMLFLQTRRRGRFLCRCSLLRRSFLGGLLGCRLLAAGFLSPSAFAAAAVFLVVSFAAAFLAVVFLAAGLAAASPSVGAVSAAVPSAGAAASAVSVFFLRKPPASPLGQKQGRPR